MLLNNDKKNDDVDYACLEDDDEDMEEYEKPTVSEPAIKKEKKDVKLHHR